MSDRIAVLMDGELIQVGTPGEIYNDPQDIRVAEFIGSPKINVLPGEIRADGGVDLLGVPTGLASGTSRGPARLGIRPEALRPARHGEGMLAGTITHMENLGPELMLHFAHEHMDHPAIMRLDHRDGRAPAVGEPIEVAFDLEAVRLFDSTGSRVQAEKFAEKQLVSA